MCTENIFLYNCTIISNKINSLISSTQTRLFSQFIFSFKKEITWSVCSVWWNCSLLIGEWLGPRPLVPWQWVSPGWRARGDELSALWASLCGALGGGGGQLAQRWSAPSASRAASCFLPSAPGSREHRRWDSCSQLAMRSGKPASRSVLRVGNFETLSSSSQLWKVLRFHTALPTLLAAADSETPGWVVDLPSLWFVQRTVSFFDYLDLLN